MAKPGPKGPIATSFKPGQSGNPGGKPKTPNTASSFKELCRQHSPAVMISALGLRRQNCSTYNRLKPLAGNSSVLGGDRVTDRQRMMGHQRPGTNQPLSQP
jgi:hypothetical protein